MSTHGSSSENLERSTAEGSLKETLKPELHKEAESSSEQLNGHAAVVASHYNSMNEKGLTERNKSRIVYLRNFNNWIKSMLINEYLSKVQSKAPYGSPIRVLDMCCGKGGDLLKWRIGKITHLICADIASVSIEDCKNRYEESVKKFDKIFACEFIVADITKERIRQQYKDASIQLDLTSCQFSFHYCFESLPQAECMLKNAAECLRPGGYFIGTIPDANAIMAKQKECGGKSFGNEVYSITFEEELKDPVPLFGAKYHFKLDGVVNCPEFLVHFPTLVRLAEKYSLKLIKKTNFQDYFKENRANGKSLLNKMSGLETFPPKASEDSVGKAEDYEHARSYVVAHPRTPHLGTLTKSEWEVACLYLVFAFQKV